MISSRCILKIIERLGLLLFSLLLCVVLSETALRVWYYIEDGRGRSLEERLQRSSASQTVDIGHSTDLSGIIEPSRFDDIVYELRPKISGIFQGKRFDFNAFGMREHECSETKPAAMKRIAGLGDSVMFGWGIDVDDSYLKQIETTANASRPSLETLNFSVPGYNTAIEVATYEHKAARFNPDLVIVHFVGNDFSVPLFMQQPREPLAVDRSYFLNFIRRRLGLLTGGSRLLHVSGKLNGDERRDVLAQYRYMEGRAGVRRAFTRLAELTAVRRIPVVILTGKHEGSNYRFLKVIAAKLNFHLVSVAPEVEAYLQACGLPNTPEQRKLLFQITNRDPHPNKLGHLLYAKALARKLVSLGYMGEEALNLLEARCEPTLPSVPTGELVKSN